MAGTNFKVKNGLEIQSGTLVVSNGAGTSGQVLKSTGTGVEWGTGSSGGVTSVSGTSPVVSSGGATPAISLASGYGDTQNPYASKTANFFLAAPNGTAGVPTFRAIVSADIPTLNQNTTGSAGSVANALTISSPLTGTSYNGSSAVSIGIPAASSTVSGYLTSTDWTTFNNKGSGTVTSVSGTSPIVSSGGATPAISIPAATSSVNGYLTSTDWTTFNNKGNGTVTSVAAGTYLTGGTITTSGTLAVDATSANTASKVVARDASGNFSAGTITATLSGNATNITAYTINQNLGTGNQVTFDSVITGNNGNGTNFRIGDDAWLGDINIANTVRLQGAQNAANAYIVFGNGDSTALGRASTGSLTYGGNAVLHAGNYNSYSPTLTGGNASGTWGISISGNAATATSATSATTTTNLSGGSVAATTGTFSGTVTIKSGSALGKLTVQTGGSDPVSPAAGDMVWYYQEQ